MNPSNDSCPGWACRGSETARLPDYGDWLAKAHYAIERGLNANAVWRLHEQLGRSVLCVTTEHDLGGES